MQYIIFAILSFYLIRYIIFGIFALIIDFAFYRISLSLIEQIDISKLIGLSFGLITTYSLNYFYNFNFEKNNFYNRGLKYLAFYIILNLFNVIENRIFFNLTNSINLSFVISAILSAFINYKVIKKYIFI